MNEIVGLILLIGVAFVLPLCLVLFLGGAFKPRPKKAVTVDAIRLPLSGGGKSFDRCPWCKSAVELEKNPHGFFECGICRCQFRHNYLKWIVGLPLLLLGAASVVIAFPLLPLKWAAIVALFLAGGIIAPIRTYLLVNQGISPKPKPVLSPALQAHLAKIESEKVTIHTPAKLLLGISLGILALIAALALAIWASKFLKGLNPDRAPARRRKVSQTSSDATPRSGNHSGPGQSSSRLISASSHSWPATIPGRC